MTDQYGDEFLNSGGGEGVASGKFTNDSGPGGRTQIGGFIQGVVVSTKQMDQTDFDSGEKILDGKGGVKQQLQVVLQTSYRNWDKASKPMTDDEDQPVEDDGKRAIYVKGWMIGAIGDAVRKTGAPGLRPGGKLAVKVTELVPPRSGQGNPFAKYLAVYEPPAPGDTFLQEAPTQQPAQQVPAQQVPAQQAPTQQPVQQPVQQVPAQQFPSSVPANEAPDPFGAPAQPQIQQPAPPAGGWGDAPSYDEPPF